MLGKAAPSGVGSGDPRASTLGRDTGGSHEHNAAIADCRLRGRLAVAAAPLRQRAPAVARQLPLLVFSAVVLLLLAACEQPEDIGPQEPPTPNVTLAPAQRPDIPPEQAAQAFFDSVQQGQHARAAQHVARGTLTMEQDQLQRELEQMGSSIAANGQAFEALDAHQDGEYAIVATRFSHAESGNGQPEIRPVVLQVENGEWRVIWELVGKEPETALDTSTLAQRLEPLYDWYDRRRQELELELVAGQPGQQPSS